MTSTMASPTLPFTVNTLRFNDSTATTLTLPAAAQADSAAVARARADSVLAEIGAELAGR